MPKFFISYRRQDSQHEADRLRENLLPYVRNNAKDIFVDVEGIPLGHDFSQHIAKQIQQTNVLLALIGKSWLEARNTETGTRRLDEEDDFVRVEISTALKLGIPVVPVLLDGASVPKADELPENLKPLSKRAGVTLNRLSFESDVERLVKGLGIRKVKIKQRVQQVVGAIIAGALFISVLLFFSNSLPGHDQSSRVSMQLCILTADDPNSVRYSARLNWDGEPEITDSVFWVVARDKSGELWPQLSGRLGGWGETERAIFDVSAGFPLTIFVLEFSREADSNFAQQRIRTGHSALLSADGTSRSSNFCETDRSGNLIGSCADEAPEGCETTGL